MTPGLTELPAIQRVEAPAAWRGTDLADAAAYTYELTPRDVEEIDLALRRAASANSDPTRPGPSPFPLPRLGVTLQTIRREVETGIGFHLIRGIPVERYSLAETETIFCGIGMHFGQPMPQSSKGEVINHVRDAGLAPTEEITGRGYQRGRALPFHSDPCDIVGLLCIHDAKSGGESAITSTYAVHNALLGARLDLLQTLYQPFHIDRHGEYSEDGPPYYSTPVFMGHHGKLFSRYNPGYVYAAQRYPETPRLTEQQAEAIETFARLCASGRFRLNMGLRPGDLQLLNNNVLVHSREAYEDHAEPARKRHLLRLWIFTSGIDGVPVPMRARYRDMEAWHANTRPRSS